MAEFALALPILLVVVFGLLEVGRAVFILAAVNNASREAVRFATAYGVNASNELQYQNCGAIRERAKRVAFLMPLTDDDIVIQYDTGPDPDTGVIPAPFDECPVGTAVDTTIELACGDRVVVTVTYHYQPIVPIIPMTAQDFTASSARTYTGVIELSDPPATCD
jgi:Flp pilus assembly protein TadG